MYTQQDIVELNTIIEADMETARQIELAKSIIINIFTIYLRGTIDDLTLTSQQLLIMKQRAQDAYNTLPSGDFKTKALEMYNSINGG
jgi:hypothetical protein